MQNRSSACLAAAVHCKKCRCKKYKYINTPNVNKHRKPVAAIKHDFCGFHHKNGGEMEYFLQMSAQFF